MAEQAKVGGDERCFMCFKSKSIIALTRGLPPTVCKGCWYEIDRTIGFLAFHGHHVEFTFDELRPGDRVDQDGVITQVINSPTPLKSEDDQQHIFKGFESTSVPAKD